MPDFRQERAALPKCRYPPSPGLSPRDNRVYFVDGRTRTASESDGQLGWARRPATAAGKAAMLAMTIGAPAALRRAAWPKARHGFAISAASPRPTTRRSAEASSIDPRRFGASPKPIWTFSGRCGCGRCATCVGSRSGCTRRIVGPTSWPSTSSISQCWGVNRIHWRSQRSWHRISIASTRRSTPSRVISARWKTISRPWAGSMPTGGRGCAPCCWSSVPRTPDARSVFFSREFRPICWQERPSDWPD
jgi:hypothetical protein